MSEQELITVVQDGVMLITLNRPDKLNALTPGMIRELFEAVGQGAAHPEVRAIVLTGAGRGFCAGLDLKIISRQEEGDANVRVPDGLPEPQFGDSVGPAVGRKASSRFGYFLSTRKPIIAAVNGPAIGFGLAVALHCDVRFASESASFNTTFARLNVPAEQGVGWLLPRLVGPAVAADLLFAPRKISSQEAQQMGLVNRVYPDADLLSCAMDYARNLATNSGPRALAVMKAQIWGYEGVSYDEALADTDREIAINTSMRDFQEAVSSYIRDETPKFVGQ